VITGTGTEDYFNGAWTSRGDTGVPFAHLYNGAPFMSGAERAAAGMFVPLARR